MPFYILFIIALSLSMDAFSLALAYGTLRLKKREMLELSIIVGCFHFIMPLLGMWIGMNLMEFFSINPYWVVFLVLLFIGIEMILDSFKQKEKMKHMHFVERLLFGFAVSVDSFSIGIGLRAITSHVIIGCFLFSMCAFFFTYLGAYLGSYLHQKLGSIATFIGGLLLVIIGIVYLFR